MKIVSWNIRAGGGVRAERIAAQIIEWNPDLVALSEFRGTPPSQTLARLLAENGFPYQRTTTHSATPAVNSLLIASRWSLRQTRLKRAPVDQHRWLHVTVKAPCPFAVIALHIPNRSTGKKYPFMESTHHVVKNWRGLPAIMMGDTNSGCIGIDEESIAFNKIEDQWMTDLHSCRWIDAFRGQYPQKREFTWYSPNRNNGFRLDQVFLHPQFANLPYRIRHIWAGYTGNQSSNRRDSLSDHAAIVLEIPYVAET